MIGGLWNGLSGLYSQEQALSVESNNLTNVNTVGHKADDIRFEDLLYQDGVGKGSAVQVIDKRMTQGDIKVTGNTYDVAIEGKGFFIVKDRVSNDINYTRAGNFRMASDGTLETADTLKVLGLTPNSLSVVSSDLNVSSFNNNYNNFLGSSSIENKDFIKTINAKATNYNVSAKASGISGDDFLSAESKIANINILISDYKEKLEEYRLNSTALSSSSSSQISKIDYNTFLPQLNDKNDLLSVIIDNKKISQNFDTNIENTLKKFSDKISQEAGLSSKVDTASSVLTITSLVPGKEVNISNAFINNSLTESINIQEAKKGSGIAMLDSSRSALKTSLENADAKLLEITNSISLLAGNTLELNEIQMKLDNLNIEKNTFGQVIIDNGKVYLKDGDNKYIVGKIQTAMFTNEQGLEAKGSNLYQNSKDSGIAKYAGDLNKIVSTSLELSNASVGTSLTSLLVYQKAFEANSKSITTSDEMLKTAIELKK